MRLQAPQRRKVTYQVYLGFSESEDDLVMTEIDI